MKLISTAIGILLLILGIGALTYQGFTYTKQENIAQIGNLKVTADTQKTVYLNPIVGGAALIAGAALLYLGRRNGK